MKKNRFAMMTIAAALLMVSCEQEQPYDEEDMDIVSTSTSAQALVGDFSVANGKQVRFAKANLRCDVWYESRGPEWRFSDNQYNYNTTGVVNPGVITLFTWGYNPEKSIITNSSDGYNVSVANGENLTQTQDWGSAIDDKGTWRTLTVAEWNYLFEGRAGAAHKYGFATVNGTHGILVLPDIFTDPMKNGGSGAFVPQTITTEWNANVYTTGGNWEAMEAAGALFLPAAGSRSGNSIQLNFGGNYETTYGRYWSSSYNKGAYALLFEGDGKLYTSTADTSLGYSVRLITEAYTVTFDLNGKDGKASEDHLIATNNTTIAKPSDPFYVGYDFVGWYKDAACTNEWNFDTDVVTANTTLYAKWVESKYALIHSEFSVAPAKRVYFSRGNLTASIDAKGTPTDWKFAANQYDCLGEGGANETIGQKAGDVDLFGWSTDKTTYGISTSIKSEDYSGDFIDWGNAIDDEGTWRTLTTDEWQYLFNTRKMKYGKDRYTLNITYGGRMGLVLYPNDYDGAALTPGVNYTDKNFPEDCVFLPAAGYRFDSNVVCVGVLSYYWSASVHENRFAFIMSSNSSVLNSDDDDAYRYGYSVRLVRDVTE